MRRKQPAKQFEADYAKRSGVTVAKLRRMGLGPKPCDCDYKNCTGWQMVNLKDWKRFGGR